MLSNLKFIFPMILGVLLITPLSATNQAVKVTPEMQAIINKVGHIENGTIGKACASYNLNTQINDALCRPMIPTAADVLEFLEFIKNNQEYPLPINDANVVDAIRRIAKNMKHDHIMSGTLMSWRTQDELTTINILPKIIFYLTSGVAQPGGFDLKSLFIVEEDIKTLPPELERLANLESLAITDAQISSFPEVIFKLKHLRELDLSDNKLESIPPQIAQLQGLTNLHLKNNPLKLISTQIFDLKNLRVLNLRNIGLKSLPPEIANLNHLRHLDLQNNNLTTLPPEIGKLSNLESLNLRGNPITSIPEEFKNIKLNILTVDERILPYLIPRLDTTEIGHFDIYTDKPIHTPEEIKEITDHFPPTTNILMSSGRSFGNLGTYKGTKGVTH